MISLTKSNLPNLGVFAQGQSHIEVPFFIFFFYCSVHFKLLNLSQANLVYWCIAANVDLFLMLRM